jgi:hypothetical protein
MNEMHPLLDQDEQKHEFVRIEIPDPNPVTRARHKKEVLWQITLPTIAFFLLVVLAAILLTVFEVGEVGTWAEISTIFLIVPVLVLSLIPLGLLAVLIYVTTMILGGLPPYAHLLQNWIDQVNQYLKQSADVVAEPIIRLASWKAMLDFFFGRVRGRD